MTTNKLKKYHKLITSILVGNKFNTPPKFHYDILEQYDSDIRSLLIVAPVGFAKSTTLKTYAIAQLVNLDNDDDLILYVSSTSTKVANQFTSIKKVLSNGLFKEYHKYKIIEDNQTTLTIEFINGKKRRIQGVASGQDISGINFEGHRPNLILIDDIEEVDTAKSVYLTNNLIEWINTTLESRLPSLVQGRIRMIGTNLTRNSIVNRIITKADANLSHWHYYKYQALDINNNSIWEDRHPAKALIEKKEALPSVFMANYQNEPMDVSDAMIKAEYVKYYTHLPPIKSISMHYDLTHTNKTTSDYSCLVVIGKGEDNNFYVIDWTLDKITPLEQSRTLIAMYERFRGYNLHKMTYDAVSNDGWRDWTINEARNKGISLPLEAIKVKGDKVSNVTSILNHFIASNVYINENHKELHLAINQLLSFPNKGVNDDFVDAVACCLGNFNDNGKVIYLSDDYIETFKNYDG